MLSRVHEHKRAAGDKAAMDFGAATAPVDIDALASYYADPDYWARMLQAEAEEEDGEG
ncbi:hypothetical protein PTKU46_83220 [Paraburkholderia terrae]